VRLLGLSYRSVPKGCYGVRTHRYVSTRKGIVSKEEQDRRFREISEAFAGIPPSSHRSIRQRLAMHKLYGETH
jgi:hypothetical protein